MTPRDRRIIEGMTIAAVFLIILPTVIEACPLDNYSSIVVWWDTGNAQLTLACRDHLDPGSRFWSDDFIGNLISNYSQWVAGYTVPIWNALVTSWFGKLILLAISALLGSFLYDLVKHLFREFYRSNPSSNEAATKP